MSDITVPISEVLMLRALYCVALCEGALPSDHPRLREVMEVRERLQAAHDRAKAKTVDPEQPEAQKYEFHQEYDCEPFTRAAAEQQQEKEGHSQLGDKLRNVLPGLCTSCRKAPSCESHQADKSLVGCAQHWRAKL